MSDFSTDNLDPASYSLKKKGGKTPLLIVVLGGLAIAGIGGYHAMHTREVRKQHAAFMEQFAALEKDDLGKFWACLLGPQVDPAMFRDNLALGARITAQFGVEPKTYPEKVKNECVPILQQVKQKITAGPVLDEYKPVVQKYGEALEQLQSALLGWVKVAPEQVADMEVGQKLSPRAGAWHSFNGGKPAADVIGFDNFLRCAVPKIDELKDTQAVVEFLFAECKDAEKAARINRECGAQLIKDDGAANPKLASTLRKFQTDDREISALDDCLRKGRKGKRRDDFAEVGKAWVAWVGAGQEVRKVGKEALKD